MMDVYVLYDDVIACVKLSRSNNVLVILDGHQSQTYPNLLSAEAFAEISSE